MRFLSNTWCELSWSPWASFADPDSFSLLPRTAGLYRVRPAGANSLVYIGQTGRDLRGRLNALRRGTMAAAMPFDGPHTAAPSLWALRDAEGLAFECAAAPIDLAKADRESLECYLLWQYRLEFGQSTRCNHGRFHPRYVKSRKRKSGQRGYRLAEQEPNNPAGGPGMAPLRSVNDLPWSAPLALTGVNLGQVPLGPGLYRIWRGDEVIYIGESESLRKRLASHPQRDWDGEAAFTFCHLPALDLAYKRHELENDLIGLFWNQHQRTPRFQFQGHTGRQ